MLQLESVIRPAKIRDLGRLQILLLAFADASLIGYGHHYRERDITNLQVKLLDLILHHYVMVAEQGGDIIGAIGAVREQDYWVQGITRLREVFWWVEPDYRSSRASAALFLRWQRDAERHLEEGRVQQVSLSTQPGVTNIDLERRGWRCVEEHWIKEK